MKGGFIVDRTSGTSRNEERGQILVLFALAAVAIIAMVGLVLDGGGAFAQRRFEQNSADMAAVAGANAYMNQSGSVAVKTAAATAAAQAAATRNHYTNGTDGSTVGVTVTLLSSGAEVRVNITDPHENSFARIVGQNQWDVSVTAAARAGTIDTASGAAPWIMSINAFNSDGSPKYGPGNQVSFGETNGDYPTDELDIAWTDYNGFDNVNSNEVRGIINGSNVVTATIDFDQYIGQHNEGFHATLFDDVDQYLAGQDVPVPIVGPGPCDPNGQPDGCFKGWAMFHVVSAEGGSSKTITGYFTGDFVGQPLSIGECTAAQQAAGTCGVIPPNSPFDNYDVRLTD
jgi:Flp pilus assembly protein TadG